MSDSPSVRSERKRAVLRQLVSMWAEAEHSAGLRDDIEVALAFVAAIRLHELRRETAAPLVNELLLLASPNWKQLETRLQQNLEALRDVRGIFEDLDAPPKKPPHFVA